MSLVVTPSIPEHFALGSLAQFAIQELHEVRLGDQGESNRVEQGLRSVTDWAQKLRACFRSRAHNKSLHRHLDCTLT